MNNKFTAGPWENCGGDIRAKWETGEEITIANTGSTRFCGNESGGPKDKRMKAEDKANASLISAAPEMYEAIKGILKVYYNPDGPEYKAVVSALKKAEGAL